MGTQLDCLLDTYRFEASSTVAELYQIVNPQPTTGGDVVVKQDEPIAASIVTRIDKDSEGLDDKLMTTCLYALVIPSTIFYPQGGTTHNNIVYSIYINYGILYIHSFPGQPERDCSSGRALPSSTISNQSPPSLSHSDLYVL